MGFTQSETEIPTLEIGIICISSKNGICNSMITILLSNKICMHFCSVKVYKCQFDIDLVQTSAKAMSQMYFEGKNEFVKIRLKKHTIQCGP